MGKDCKDFDYENDRIIIESIANKLFVKYPNEFASGSERDSWVDVRGCSKIGTSSDGKNTFYNRAVWMVVDGYYDVRI